LKAFAPEKVSLIEVTERVSHPPSGWLKDLAHSNVFSRDVTAPVRNSELRRRFLDARLDARRGKAKTIRFVLGSRAEQSRDAAEVEAFENISGAPISVLVLHRIEPIFHVSRG